MHREGVNAMELRIDRSTFVVKCSARPNIKPASMSVWTSDPEVGCSTSSCRETAIPDFCRSSNT